MTLADKLRNKGINKPDFTKESLMKALERKIGNCGSTSYIIGRHVGTDVEGDTIGTCNVYNYGYLLKCLEEEGFKWSFSTNSYGVDSIKIHI